MKDRTLIFLSLLCIILIGGCDRPRSTVEPVATLEAASPPPTPRDLEFEKLFPGVKFNEALRLALKGVTEASVTDGKMTPRTAQLIMRINSRSGFTFPAGFGPVLYVYRDDQQSWERIPSGVVVLGDDEKITPALGSTKRDIELEAGLTWGALGNLLPIDRNSSHAMYRVVVIGTADDNAEKHGAYIDIVISANTPARQSPR
jgi:hypothetical protein